MSQKSYVDAVNTDHQRSYEEFLNDPTLLETKREAALLRTVLFQFMDNMQRMADGKVETFQKAVASSIAFELTQAPHRMDEDAARGWGEWLAGHVKAPFFQTFGRINGIGHKELKAVSSTVKDLAKLLETEMNLQQGQVLTLEGDIDDIHYILRNGVFPFITHEQRKAIINNIRELIQERMAKSAGAFNLEVDDVPFEEADYEMKETEADPMPHLLLPPITHG